MNAPMTKPAFPYTTLAEAVALLHARRAAAPLTNGSLLAERLAAKPCAVFSPHIATPNFELARFVSLASSAGLAPLVLEFQDKFVTCNPAKHALIRMRFYGGIGRNGGPRNRVLTVADLNAADGTPFCQTTTSWGQGLIPLHHELLRSRPELSGVEIVDGSPFFLAHSGGARGYYPEFFSLFIRHAILFESFLHTPSEQQFTSGVAIPAFKATCERHGCQPLICRLDPPGREGDPYWYHYPDELYEPVAAKLAALRAKKETA